MANDMQNKVREFHRVGGLTIGDSPAIRDADLRAKLILEEAAETVVALVGGSRANDLFAQLSVKEAAQPDLAEVIDGLCDVLYVVFGTAVALGVDLQPFFDEVHRTNLEKANGPRRADGKIMKPPGWEPPRIREMLEKVVADKPETLVPNEVEAYAESGPIELRVRALGAALHRTREDVSLIKSWWLAQMYKYRPDLNDQLNKAERELRQLKQQAHMVANAAELLK